MVDRTTVLVLGTGELSSELVLSFQRLGTRATAVPAPTGAAALRTLIDRHTPQVVVVQSPAADLGADVVQALAGLEEVAVFPTPGALRLASDREALRTLAANELGLPTAPFWFVTWQSQRTSPWPAFSRGLISLQVRRTCRLSPK